jgi:hypothetical protein
MSNGRWVTGSFFLLFVAIACSDEQPQTQMTAGQGAAPSPGGGAGSTAPSPAGGGGDEPAGGAGTAAAGGSGGSPANEPAAGSGGAPADPGMMLDPRTPLGEIPESCKGFEFVGLEHSPGGSVLPNKCAPFHNVFNNPYAIRCIDADPSYSTGWPGDEWCILPPDPEKGIQVGVNPADYDNPAAGFVLEPGREVTQNYYANAQNPEARYFYRVNVRLRTGSHHVINSLIADRADGWTMDQDTGLGQRGFLGAQRPDADRPMTLEVPEENAGHGDELEANQQFQFNMHHFNFTTEPVLREIWANIWWKDQSEVKEVLGSIGIFAPIFDINIPPGEHRELHYSCDVPGNTRIVTLNGHRHASTDRFGVWIVREGGAIENVYESFDYNDMPTYSYDSLSMNPVPDLATKKDGATSGVLNVAPGDKIHFVCDITNDIPENIENNVTLRFANEVMTGEMCILFGSRTGDALCTMNVNPE